MEGVKTAPGLGNAKRRYKVVNKEEVMRRIFLEAYALSLEYHLQFFGLEGRKERLNKIAEEYSLYGIISEEEADKKIKEGIRKGEEDAEEIKAKNVRGEFSRLIETSFDAGGSDAGKILMANFEKNVKEPKEVVYELITTVFPLMDYVATSEEGFSEELIDNLREVLLPFYWFLRENCFDALLKIFRNYWNAIDYNFGMPLPVGG